MLTVADVYNCCGLISMLSLVWEGTLPISNDCQFFPNAKHNVVTVNKLQLIRSNLFQIYFVFISSLHILIPVISMS